jgi:transcriptional regulator with XRE-family HTH domain
MGSSVDLDARVRVAFAKRLRSLLDEGPGITRAQLAERSGIPDGTLVAYLRGLRAPGLVNLLALRRGLGLGSIEELLDRMPSQKFPES